NSDQASAMGTLSTGAQSYTGLTINMLASGSIDQDFYRWTVGASGTLTVVLTNIQSAGDLEVRVYNVNSNGTLSQIAAGTNLGHLTSQAASASISAGASIIVYVSGFNFSVGSYDMTVALA